MLGRLRAGDGLARSKLAEANLRFVVNVARKYQNQGLAFEDMVSEGNLGLLSAIDHFDPEKGYHLISYAVWWIRQAILKAICEKSRMIRLPMNRSNELMQIERMRKGFIIEKGKEPAEADIARITGIKTRDVKDLLAISRDVISLETPIYGDDNYLGDYLEDDNLKTPEYHAIADYLSSDIDKLLDTISEKEADILRRRFGLNGKSPESLKDIGVSELWSYKGTYKTD